MTATVQDVYTNQFLRDAGNDGHTTPRRLGPTYDFADHLAGK